MTSSIVPSPFGTFSLPLPWATPAVDSVICALDARNVGIPEIVRRVKKQFPALAPSAISIQAVEKRILILDQIIEIDYFKHGLGLGSRSIENGVGATKAVKHGLAIHANTGEAWEKSGMPTAITKASTESLHGPILGLERLTVKTSTDSLKEPGRGARLGLAIHKNHGEKWETLSSTKALSPAREVRTIHDAFPKLDALPRPTSPCRGDESGRPSAVDRSLRNLRSLDIERPSVENQRRRGHTGPPTMQVSPFPKVPLHQRSNASLKKTASADKGPRTLAPADLLKMKKSTTSLKKAREVLRKKPSHEYNRRPIIHITKPSQEQSLF